MNEIMTPTELIAKSVYLCDPGLNITCPGCRCGICQSKECVATAKKEVARVDKQGRPLLYCPEDSTDMSEKEVVVDCFYENE